MKNHFYEHANISSIIDKLNPKVVMELGCGNFENFLCILTYLFKSTSDYVVIGISDNPCPLVLSDFLLNKIMFIQGVSYTVLNKFKTVYKPKMIEKFVQPVGLAIIDTDHNYYTLKKELDELLPLLDEKCCLAFHDTNTYEEAGLSGQRFANINPDSNSTYEFEGYKDGSEYPLNQIVSTLHKSLMDAINEFIEVNKGFKLLYKTTEKAGCCVIGRNFEL